MLDRLVMAAVLTFSISLFISVNEASKKQSAGVLESPYSPVSQISQVMRDR